MATTCSGHISEPCLGTKALSIIQCKCTKLKLMDYSDYVGEKSYMQHTTYEEIDKAAGSDEYCSNNDLQFHPTATMDMGTRSWWICRTWSHQYRSFSPTPFGSICSFQVITLIAHKYSSSRIGYFHALLHAGGTCTICRMDDVNDTNKMDICNPNITSLCAYGAFFKWHIK